MDGLIVIRSVTLSNDIAKTHSLEVVAASYYWALRECHRDSTITPKEDQRL
jgi:hypothetical protein